MNNIFVELQLEKRITEKTRVPLVADLGKQIMLFDNHFLFQVKVEVKSFL